MAGGGGDGREFMIPRSSSSSPVFKFSTRNLHSTANFESGDFVIWQPLATWPNTFLLDGIPA